MYPSYFNRNKTISKKNDPIQFLRNEAHRFGITHHRNRRSKNAFISEISEIKGIGEKTFEQLMKHFKTISAIKNAKKEELTKIIGLSKTMIILNYFKEKS